METFLMNAENFSNAQETLDNQLAQLKIKQKDALRAELLVEEIFWRMTNQGKAAQIKVQVVKKLFGKVQVKLHAEGTAYNPLVEVSDLGEDDEDYYRMLILKTNRRRLSWIHKQNKNVVTINVSSESNAEAWLTIAGIAGGVVCGVVMKEFLSPEIISLVNDSFIAPIRTMFLNALGMVIAPVIFFSIISGIIGMGTSADTGKIGLKLLAFMGGTTMISLLVSLIVSWFLFSGGVSAIGISPSASTDVATYEFSFVQFITDIIPTNIVSPFAEGKFLQIIFIALLIGICLNTLGDKVRLFKEMVSNLNDLFIKMISMIISFVPPIAFFAMISLVLESNVETVLLISKLIVGQLVICCVMFGVYLLLIRYVGKISPLPYLKRVFAVCPIAFATSSSNAAMPAMMDLCTNKLGIAPKFASFLIPLAVPSNMCSSCIY